MIQFKEVESIKKINKLRKKKLQLHQRILTEVLNNNNSASFSNNISNNNNLKNISESNNELVLPHIPNINYKKNFKKKFLNNISHESTEFSSNYSNNNINQSYMFLYQGHQRISNYNNHNTIDIIPE
jgi:hypothetical protein